MSDSWGRIQTPPPSHPLSYTNAYLLAPALPNLEKAPLDRHPAWKRKKFEKISQNVQWWKFLEKYPGRQGDTKVEETGGQFDFVKDTEMNGYGVRYVRTPPVGWCINAGISSDTGIQPSLLVRTYCFLTFFQDLYFLNACLNFVSFQRNLSFFFVFFTENMHQLSQSGI